MCVLPQPGTTLSLSEMCFYYFLKLFCTTAGDDVEFVRDVLLIFLFLKLFCTAAGDDVEFVGDDGEKYFFIFLCSNLFCTAAGDDVEFVGDGGEKVAVEHRKEVVVLLLQRLHISGHIQDI